MRFSSLAAAKLNGSRVVNQNSYIVHYLLFLSKFFFPLDCCNIVAWGPWSFLFKVFFPKEIKRGLYAALLASRAQPRDGALLHAIV